MTYISNWIEKLDVTADHDSGSKIFAKDLPQPLSRFGPYELADWAKDRGLSIEYVDNCWVRVAVTGQDLIAFLAKHYGADHPFVLETRARVSGPCRYVIVAEEF